ncbi:MAG: hypothetical protein R3B09_14400 [Nannocystaceae bacterium]
MGDEAGDARRDPPADAATLALLRGAYLLGRELLAPLTAAGDPSRHLVYRLRVLLTTLGVHLEGHDGAWLAAIRTLDADLHRLALDRLGGRAGADEGAEAGLAAEQQARVREALRAADRATFSARRVDLHGASLLTGLARADLRGSIEGGALAAIDDGRGPLVDLDALAGFAAARGLGWHDGLEDAEAGARAEDALARLVGGGGAPGPRTAE